MELGGRRWWSWLWQCKGLGAGGVALGCDNAWNWEAGCSAVVIMQGIGGQAMVQLVVAMRGTGGRRWCICL